MTEIVCAHGGLARQCWICELAGELAEAKAMVAVMEGALMRIAETPSYSAYPHDDPALALREIPGEVCQVARDALAAVRAAKAPVGPGAILEPEARHHARVDRLRSLGYEEPSDEQRREQLNRNVAMLDWPKTQSCPTERAISEDKTMDPVRCVRCGGPLD